MFPSFTGNSRRPRQVNLSGRNNNPFVTHSGSPQLGANPAPQNAIIHAQQERLARQIERERLQAARKIQKTWRGYCSRRNVRGGWREIWDQQEEAIQARHKRINGKDEAQNGKASGSEMLAQLRLLVRFASSYHQGDIVRVQRFTRDFCSWVFLQPSKRRECSGKEWAYPLLSLVKTAAAMLRQCLRDSPVPAGLLGDLLAFLATSASIIPEYMVHYSFVYYGTICKILRDCRRTPAYFFNIALIRKAITALLEQNICVPSTLYEALISQLLTIPHLHDILGGLDFLSTTLEPGRLAATLKQILLLDLSPNLVLSRPREEILWLLSYFTHIFRIHPGKSSDKLPSADYIIVVSKLLNYLSEDIQRRIDVSEYSSEDALPAFVRFEILTLVDQKNVTNLLAGSELIGFVGKSEKSSVSGTAAVASFALTLIRVFKRRGDDIRMWLYLGSTFLRNDTRNQAQIRIPALKYFWNAISETNVYNSIQQHPNNAVNLLRRSESDGSLNQRGKQQGEAEDWRIILLFLELYSFVLKVTDDEEFMSGSSYVDEHQSWTRQSALEITNVGKLVVFLKNLAFAIYWNGTQIVGAGNSVSTPSLASYFGAAEAVLSTKSTEVTITELEDMIISGLDISLSYLKGLVTGLLRMIYERE